jgi:hypothetical protein
MDKHRVLHAIRQGLRDPFHAARYHGGGKGSAPPAPDYRGAAEAEAAASKENLTQQTWANRPNIFTPWGSQTWQSSSTIDPTTGQPVTSWQSDIVLSPEQQEALDSQMRVQSGRSGAAEMLLDQATGAFGTPFDWEGMPQVGDLGQAQAGAYEKLSAMAEPGRTRRQSALDTRLANMGLTMGGEAHRRAQGELGEQFAQQDKGFMAQAMAEGRADIAAQQARRQAAIAEEGQRRGMPLNELNALLTGQQVNMPSMPGFSQAGMAQAPDYTGAAANQGQYGLSAAQLKSQSGIDWGSLAGSAMMAAAMY